MSGKRLAASVARRVPPATEVRQATVLGLLAPGVDQVTGRDTGWQVQLDYGGGEVRNAAVAGRYEPVPGDRVIVAAFLGRLYVIDRIAAAGGSEPPGKLVATSGAVVGATYASVTGTTDVEVSAMRLTGVPLRNGAAYEVLLRTGYTTSVANSFVFLRLRQTDVAGTDLGEWFRYPSGPTGAVYGAFGRLVVANTTGRDLAVTMVPTVSTAAGVTANLYGNATSPAYLEINRLGPASRYPYAAGVTVPPDL